MSKPAASVPSWRSLAVAPLLAACPLAAAQPFPFLISYDGPDNASSVAHLLEAPAGKHGFVRVVDGHFANDAGPIRLNGTNLTGPANFPTHADADLLAARLARFGLNCVRLHYMDADYGNFRNPKQPGIVAADPATQRRLDPGQLDRLDYLVAALKKRGIYVNVNLHVARQWDARDGFPPARGRPWADKGLDNFEPRMIELQKEYARLLLTHPNRYTGLSFADDPCVAVVELNNENALFHQYLAGGLDRLPEPYAGEFRRQWNAWLRIRHGSTEALRRAWRWEPVPLGEEQIPDGSFAGPVTLDGTAWTLALGQAQATAAAGDGALRIEVSRGGNEYFPKLFRQVTVRKGQPYTLAFRIRRTAGQGRATLGLGVADTVGGWRSLGLHRTLAAGTEWTEFRQSFEATADSEAAQVQLTRFPAGDYELAGLSFRHGTESGLRPGQRIEDGSMQTIPARGFATEPARRDFLQFLVDTERAYWTDLADYLRRELGVRVPISGTQLGYSPPAVQAELDYVDNHSYWCHPSPVGTGWRLGNKSMVDSLSCIRGLASQRVLGKPYTVSEYNHPFPNQYGAEGQPMLRAYGSLQGWDGVFEYTYNHRLDFAPKANTYFFSIIARTDVLAHLPACAAIYLRGDVREATGTVAAAMPYATYFDRLVARGTVAAGIAAVGMDTRLAMVHRTGVDLAATAATEAAPPPEGRVVASDTGELVWDTALPGGAFLAIDTPNTKLFTGFPRGRAIDLGGVSLAIGETRLGWATVSLVSRHATGFGETGRAASILLAATGLAENQGMRIESTGGGQIHMPEPWGGETVLVEGVPLAVELPAPAGRVRCFALGPDGERRGEVPVTEQDGRARLVLGPAYRTVWYEIEIGAEQPGH